LCKESCGFLCEDFLQGKSEVTKMQRPLIKH
jgi:hypothetical protein